MRTDSISNDQLLLSRDYRPVHPSRLLQELLMRSFPFVTRPQQVGLLRWVRPTAKCLNIRVTRDPPPQKAATSMFSEYQLFRSRGESCAERIIIRTDAHREQTQLAIPTPTTDGGRFDGSGSCSLLRCSAAITNKSSCGVVTLLRSI